MWAASQSHQSNYKGREFQRPCPKPQAHPCSDPLSTEEPPPCAAHCCYSMFSLGHFQQKGLSFCKTNAMHVWIYITENYLKRSGRNFTYDCLSNCSAQLAARAQSKVPLLPATRAENCPPAPRRVTGCLSLMQFLSSQNSSKAEAMTLC